MMEGHPNPKAIASTTFILNQTKAGLSQTPLEVSSVSLFIYFKRSNVLKLVGEYKTSAKPDSFRVIDKEGCASIIPRDVALAHYYQV